MKSIRNGLVVVLFSVICVGFVMPKSAYSVVDLRVGYSFGNLYDDSTKIAKESGIDFEVLFQVIPLLPLAFDLTYSLHNLELDLDEGNKDVDYSKITCGVSAWIPFIPVITPFATVRFIPWQDIDYTGISVKPGYGFAGGFKVSIIPMFSAYAAFNYEMAKGKHKGDYNSKYGTLGVELSL